MIKETKVCKKCGIEKNINEFRLQKIKNKKYYRGVCKKCENEMNSIYWKERRRKENPLIMEKEELAKQGLKKCTKCNQIKSIEEFTYRKDSSCYRGECKKCETKRRKEYYNNNIDKIKKIQKEYTIRNKQSKIEYDKKYRKENKKAITKRQSAWCKRKRTEDKIYKLKGQVRCCLRDSFRRKKYKKNSNSEKIIGCEWEFFINYLLNKFKNNYGYDWDGKEKISIDHIIPLATAKTEEEVIKLCHYTNLQLLKAKDNMKKHTKLDWRLDDVK